MKPIAAPSTKRLSEWQKAYHWPFMFFASVLVWNLIGAGHVRVPHQSAAGALLHAGPQHDRDPRPCGPVRRLRHAWAGSHAVLHARAHGSDERWNKRLLAISFWCLNIGLAMMVFLSLLPQGLWQTYASFTHDYAYARSAEVIHGPVMQALVWARVPGDLVFAVGVFAFAWFVAQAYWSTRKRQ